MQKRRYDFQADDDTASLNRWFSGIHTPGLYYGFDFNPTANLNINFVHTVTGLIDVDPTPATSPAQSLVVTRQGVVVKEDSAITINGVAPGHATLPRIDLIVMSHAINVISGGAQALYSIITGTPNAMPVAPALTDVTRQVVIGQLNVPAAMVALNGGGVSFTRVLAAANPSIVSVVAAEASIRATAIATEAAARVAADNALATSIAAEATARANGDTALAAALAAAISAIVPGAWINIPVTAPWTNQGSTHLKYRIDYFGKVHFSGLPLAPFSGGVPNKIADLPAALAGYPCFGLGLVLSLPVTPVTGSPAYLRLDPVGGILIDLESGGSIANSADFSLAGVSFWPDEYV